MDKTNAERQRRYRERLKQRAVQAEARIKELEAALAHERQRRAPKAAPTSARP